MFIFLLVIIVTIKADTKVKILFDNDFESTFSLSRCLVEASKIYFSTVTFIIPRERPEQKLKPISLNYLFLSSLGLDQNITYFISNLDAYDTDEDLMSIKTRNCILQIRDMAEFEDSIDRMAESAEWSAKSKLLVVSKILFDDPRLIAGRIIKILQEKDVLNVVVLLPSPRNPSNYSIYAPLTPTESSCGEIFQPVVIDSCTDGTFSNDQSWFPRRKAKHTQGCLIRASYRTWPPYAINVDAGYQSSNHFFNQGLEVNLLNMLASLLDFQIVYQQAKTWGNILENGTGTEDFVLLLNKSVDILISAYTITYTRNLYVETSVSYIRESLMWCVPHVPVWSSIPMGQPEVCVLVVSIYATLSISLWLVSRNISAEFAAYKFLMNTSLASFGVILGIALKVLPRTRKSRYIMALVIFFGYYTSTLYTSVLTSRVMSPSFEEKYSSMEDIYDHNLSTYFAINTLRYFEGDIINGVPQSLIRSKAVYCYNMTKCLDSVATEKWAYLCPRMASSFHIQHNENRRKKIDCFIYSSVGVPIAMMMRKGFPLQELFDTVIHRILNAGFLVKWERDIMRYYDEDEGRNDGVTIDNLRDIFKLLVLGYLVSCGVFVIERYVGRHKMNKWLQRAKSNISP